jgi:transposase
MHNKKGPLIALEYPGGKGGDMNSVCYQDQVLDPVLLELIQSTKQEHGNILFMQDGAPSHCSKLTTAWFTEHHIKLFPHPFCSPDMGPIERLWYLLKVRIQELLQQPTTFEDLKQAALEAWDALTLEEVNSIPQFLTDEQADGPAHARQAGAGSCKACI